jgi:hypothetical protein
VPRREPRHGSKFFHIVKRQIIRTSVSGNRKRMLYSFSFMREHE